jgi:hypothetical protein
MRFKNWPIVRFGITAVSNLGIKHDPLYAMLANKVVQWLLPRRNTLLSRVERSSPDVSNPVWAGMFMRKMRQAMIPSSVYMGSEIGGFRLGYADFPHYGHD